MNSLVEYEDLPMPVPDESQAQPECPGCSAPVIWVDPQFPFCAVCGANLYWPVPERI